MTEKQAMKLQVRDIVCWDNNKDDTGTVVRKNPNGFFVEWDNGQKGWIAFNSAQRVYKS